MDPGSVRFRVGEWTVSTSSNEILRGDERVRLESRLIRTLTLLHANNGAVVTREQLIEEIWDGRAVSDHSISVVISDLRKALGDSPHAPRYIETVPKRGYRLVVENERTGPRFPGKSLAAVVTLALAAIAAVLYLERDLHKPSPLAAVLTMTDVRNTTNDDDLDRLAMALSEIGAHYLAHVEDVRVVRHWWNFDASDPTGGIPDRYGADVPIYYIDGSLVDRDGEISIALFLNDPATDEVLWSTMYAVDRDRFAAEHVRVLGRMLGELGLDEGATLESASGAAGEPVELFWAGHYLWNLETKEAARLAAPMWERARTLAPGFEWAHTGLRAVGAEWPDVVPVLGDAPPPRDDVVSLTGSATVALRRDRDPARAGTLARRALELAPSSARAGALLAQSLAHEGELDAALDAIRHARWLAPYTVAYQWHETLLLLVSGDALAARDVLPDDDADDPAHHAVRALVLEAADEVEAAAEARARLDDEPRTYLPTWAQR